MPFVIAVIIIALLAFKFVRFRCYVCFNLLMIGFAALVAGLMIEESLFTVGGAAFLIGGLLIMFLTSLKVERSRRPYYMLNLFLSGLFSFLHLMLLMMIITIPFAKMMKMMATDYRERVLVDAYGRKTGTVYVDEHGRTPDGKQYTPYDPYD